MISLGRSIYKFFYINHFVKTISIIFCFIPVITCDQVSFERVISPNFWLYESLFFKFGYAYCPDSCDKTALNQMLDYAFYQEALAYANDSAQRVFIQAVLLNEVIGYMSCQAVSDDQMDIHHLIIDPELYNDSLVKDFLFLLFEVMPKLRQISIQVPVLCIEVTNLLENLGFESDEQVYTIDESGLADAILYATYNLKVPSKCAMCNVLYGENFWNIDEDFVIGMSDPDDDADDERVAVDQRMDVDSE